MELQVTGTLFVGVEYEGKRHRDFTLRPLYVRDSIAVNDQAALDADRGQARGPFWVNVALLAAQLEKLGTIPRDKITPAMLEDLLDEDMLVFEGARISLQKKIRAANSAAPAKSKKPIRRSSPASSAT